MRRYRFEIRESADRQWYLVLLAGNGQVLMTSETYLTRAYALAAARKMRRWMWAAKIDD